MGCGSRLICMNRPGERFGHPFVSGDRLIGGVGNGLHVGQWLVDVGECRPGRRAAARIVMADHAYEEMAVCVDPPLTGRFVATGAGLDHVTAASLDIYRPAMSELQLRADGLGAAGAPIEGVRRRAYGRPGRRGSLIFGRDARILRPQLAGVLPVFAARVRRLLKSSI